MNIFKNNTILKENVPLFGSIFAGIVIGISLLWVVMPQTTNADFVNTTDASSSNERKKPVKTIKVVITAYSSTPDQTDDSPFITASGKRVADGIIANNMLPFGTKVKIPVLYGDKIFIVQDRMNRRKSDYHFDIWMPERHLAVNFGIQKAELIVLEN